MNKEQIKKLISEAIRNSRFKSDIKSASLFGSYLRGESTSDSDVDILIEFKPSAKIGLFGLARFQRNLEETIGKKVDILTPQSLSKFFRERVLKESETIYEG